jgi:hypothetical protein
VLCGHSPGSTARPGNGAAVFQLLQDILHRVPPDPSPAAPLELPILSGTIAT